MIGGFGVWELLIVLIVLIMLVLPIYLVFRFKRTRPNNITIGAILGVLTPIAQFYPTAHHSWFYFIGLFLLLVVFKSLNMEGLGWIAVMVGGGAVNVYRIKSVS